MTLYNIINGLKEIALTHPNVRTAKDGDIYNILNSNPSVKYGAFIITQGVHRETEKFTYYGLTLFYVDRLEDDLEDNRLQVQSIGKQLLSNIIHVFCEEYDVDVPVKKFKPFTQKFQDETSGIYCQIELEVPIDLICPEYYE